MKGRGGEGRGGERERKRDREGKGKGEREKERGRPHMCHVLLAAPHHTERGVKLTIHALFLSEFGRLLTVKVFFFY